MSLINELKRRNVFRVAAAYLVSAWLIIQVADTILPLFGFDESPTRMIVLVLAIGFIPAMIVAWVFQLTPEGLKRDSEIDSSVEVTPGAHRKLDRTIAVVLVLALAYFAFDKFIISPQRETVIVEQAMQAGAEQAREEFRLSQLSEKSIAVLPFVTRSNQQDTGYFAEGIHDDLLTLLANIGSLRVISRTSVLKYRDTDRNLREIGQELGAQTILEGGIQQAGENVRINMQLIDAGTDEHLWAQSWDRKLTLENVFAIQTEIAQSIADQLQATLSPREQRRIQRAPTLDLQAQEAYIKGKLQLDISTFDALGQARDLFRQAIDMDPGYTQARIALAETWSRLSGTGAIDRQAMLANGLEHIEQALIEDPDNSYGQAVSGLYQQAREMPGAEQTIQNAIELSPNNVKALEIYSDYLRSQQRHAEALAITNRALELDPLSVGLYHNKGRALTFLGRFDEAQQAFDRISEINPGNPYATHGNALATILAGQLAKAAYWSDLNMDADPDDYESSATTVTIYLSLGQFEIARERLDRALKQGADEPYPMAVHSVYQLLTGNPDKALLLARTGLANNLEDRWGSELTFLGVLQRHAVQVGEYDEALGWFRQKIPECFSATPDVNAGNLTKATDLAHLLLLTGQSEQGETLLDTIITRFDELYQRGAANYPLGIGKVDALALQGKKQAAISELRRLVDDGYRVRWQFNTIYNQNHRSLHGDPEYQSILDFIESDIQRQLAMNPGN